MIKHPPAKFGYLCREKNGNDRHVVETTTHLAAELLPRTPAFYHSDRPKFYGLLGYTGLCSEHKHERKTRKHARI
jgi:hypothetical protein